jgi:hypothetical protein
MASTPVILPPYVSPLVDGDPAVLGGYLLLGRLGEGGMGTVYAGLAQDLERVAVKLAKPGRRAGLFQREVELMSRVEGVCGVGVHATGTYRGRPWAAIEYVPGLGLDRYVREHGPLTGSTLGLLATGCAEALAAIHRAGVAHGDIKPGNVLMTPSGPKVVDYGIARLVDGAPSAEFMGTPGWLAPERYDRRPPDRKSDMFAWACLVVFAATGQSPFGPAPRGVAFGDRLREMARRAHAGEVDLEGLPEHLRALCVRALASDPALRPTAEEAYLECLLHLSPATEGTRTERLRGLLSRLWPRIDVTWDQPRRWVGAAVAMGATGSAPFPGAENAHGTAPTQANGTWSGAEAPDVPGTETVPGPQAQPGTGNVPGDGGVLSGTKANSGTEGGQGGDAPVRTADPLGGGTGAPPSGSPVNADRGAGGVACGGAGGASGTSVSAGGASGAQTAGTASRGTGAAATTRTFGIGAATGAASTSVLLNSGQFTGLVSGALVVTLFCGGGALFLLDNLAPKPPPEETLAIAPDPPPVEPTEPAQEPRPGGEELAEIGLDTFLAADSYEVVIVVHGTDTPGVYQDRPEVTLSGFPAFVGHFRHEDGELAWLEQTVGSGEEWSAENLKDQDGWTIMRSGPNHRAAEWFEVGPSTDQYVDNLFHDTPIRAWQEALEEGVLTEEREEPFNQPDPPTGADRTIPSGAYTDHPAVWMIGEVSSTGDQYVLVTDEEGTPISMSWSGPSGFGEGSAEITGGLSFPMLVSRGSAHLMNPDTRELPAYMYAEYTFVSFDEAVRIDFPNPSDVIPE